MRQIRKAKRRPGTARWWQEPVPADACDPEIVRAHQIARQASRARARQARAELGQRDLPTTRIRTRCLLQAATT